MPHSFKPITRVPVPHWCHARRPAREKNRLACGKTGQAIVEVAGIEPASSGLSIGLLRAQPVLDCRDRYVHWQLWRSVSG